MTIPLNTRNATGFEFIKNDHNEACLFLKQLDSYYILLLDSNYQIIAEFSDRYYTAISPKFIGSLSEKNHFELFFRRHEDDVLLVLDMDTEAKTIKRTKDYKITDLSNEKIIYTGSNIIGDKMITISRTNNNLIYKKHLSGFKIDKTLIPLTDDDREFIIDGHLRQFTAKSDSLVLMFKNVDVNFSKPQFRLLNVNLNTGKYSKLNFCIDDNVSDPISFNAYLIDSIIILKYDYENFKIHNSINGDLIGQFSVDLDSIILNKNCQLFKYGYDCKFDLLSMPTQYKNLIGKERNEIYNVSLSKCDFIRDSLGVYLELLFAGRTNNYNQCYYNIRTILPFDWVNKRINYNEQLVNHDWNDYIKNHIDKKVSMKLKALGYFWGFDNDFLFGYLLKKNKEFVIEKVDF